MQSAGQLATFSLQSGEHKPFCEAGQFASFDFPNFKSGEVMTARRFHVCHDKLIAIEIWLLQWRCGGALVISDCTVQHKLCSRHPCFARILQATALTLIYRVLISCRH